MHHLFALDNPKTIKGEKQGWLTAILHLAPADTAGFASVCPRSTAGCRATCLYYAGRSDPRTPIGRQIHAARIRKTRMYFQHRAEFTRMLVEDVHHLERRASRKGLRLAVRVNGTSDLPALARAVASESPDAAVFYDYTKVFGAWDATERIRYTFSRSEENEAECARALSVGVNVAVVFDTRRGCALPTHYTLRGVQYRVIDGDAHDLRFLDQSGVVVGLRAKGRARAGGGGFVKQAA